MGYVFYFLILGLRYVVFHIYQHVNLSATFSSEILDRYSEIVQFTVVKVYCFI